MLIHIDGALNPVERKKASGSSQNSFSAAPYTIYSMERTYSFTKILSDVVAIKLKVWLASLAFKCIPFDQCACKICKE